MSCPYYATVFFSPALQKRDLTWINSHNTPETEAGTVT